MTVAVFIGAICSLSACSGSPQASDTSTTTSANYFQSLIGAGRHLLRNGNANAAEQLFQQAIRRDPKSPVGYYDLGVVYEEKGQQAQALHQYQLAFRVNPRYVPALFNAAVLVDGQNPQQAMGLYRRIIAIQPDSPTALLNLGLLEAKANDETQALRDLRQALHLDPGLLPKVPAPLRSQVGDV
jgi:Tfp pilus assembly protein PilF